MGGSFETRESEPKKPEEEIHHWAVDNIAHPFVNQAVIEPLNAIASVSQAVTGKDMGRIDKYDVPQSNDTGSWLAQTLSGGVGAIAPFVVAGKMTGGAMQSGGRMLEANNLITTGGMSAQFLASERSAMIIGAGLYGGARDPINHESRFGNAVGSMVGMGAFELGNSFTKGLALSKSIPLRALVGAGGGSLQTMTSNLISEGKVGSPDDLMKSAASGAALNLFLPAATHQFGKVVDAANVKLGRPIPADHFAARENWTGDEALKAIMAKSPLTRVVRNDAGGPSIDQTSNVVKLGPSDGAEKLGHEVSHRISNRQAENDFKAAAELLKTDPEAAKQKYIDIRTAQEKAALEAENLIRSGKDGKSYADVNPDSIRDMRIDQNTTYGDKFAKEAAEFEKSGGKSRPETDHGEYKGTNDQGLHMWLYDEPKPDPNGGDVPVRGYETNADKSFQRWTKADAKLDPTNPNKTWGAIEAYAEAQEGPYGKYTRSETFPDHSTSYKIVDGPFEGTTVRVFEHGLQTEYGDVVATTTHSDGRIDYTKRDNTTAHEYAEPRVEWFGKIKAEDNKADGTTFYKLTDGATVEVYENPLKVTIGMPDGTTREIEVNTAWRSNGMAKRSLLDRHNKIGEETEGEPVAGSAPIKSEYILEDTSAMEQIYHPDHLEIVEDPMNGAPKNSIKPTFIAESHPSPIQTAEGPVTQIVRTFDSTIYDIADGDGTRLQVYNPGYSRPTEFGDVSRVSYLKDGYINYEKTDGNKVLLHSKNSIDTPFGPAKAIETAVDGTSLIHRAPSGVVEVYRTPVTTNEGAIDAVEKTPTGLKLYGSNGAKFASLDLDFVSQRKTYFDANGDIMENGYQAMGDFMLLRRFNPTDYPNGKSLPEISDKGVLSIETNNRGYNIYKLVDGTAVTDAPEQN